MFGYNGYQNNPAVGYQMQVNQNRINQLEQQYNPYQAYQQPVQQTQQQVIKGRPVSSYEEAKASMIDLDGSLFVFPDIANGRIYTKVQGCSISRTVSRLFLFSRLARL